MVGSKVGSSEKSMLTWTLKQVLGILREPGGQQVLGTLIGATVSHWSRGSPEPDSGIPSVLSVSLES